MYVAMMRALADAGLTGVRGFADPIARRLLDDRWRRQLERAERWLRRGARGRAARFLRGNVDLLALRTVVIDAAAARELAADAAQVVVLGAGLDSRAWRMRNAGRAHVFEVDHPATQAYKRERVGSLAPCAAAVSFVAVDFERDSIGGALDAAGHDASAATVWIWEGVVMYLGVPAFRATLRALSARSAPGSVLVVHYHTALRGGPLGWLLRLIGEPMRATFAPRAMAAELAGAG